MTLWRGLEHGAKPHSSANSGVNRATHFLSLRYLALELVCAEHRTQDLKSAFFHG